MIGDHPDRDALVAYSLGALDPREAAAVEAHAPGCARCTRELEALAPAVAVLGESVEQLEPPPEL
ncbi:MAG: zf-HC2 domain-containing protein, partial [Solirubrobacterales bacterium]